MKVTSLSLVIRSLRAFIIGARLAKIIIDNVPPPTGSYSRVPHKYVNDVTSLPLVNLSLRAFIIGIRLDRKILDDAPLRGTKNTA